MNLYSEITMTRIMYKKKEINTAHGETFKVTAIQC